MRLHARYLEPEPLRAQLRTGVLQPGKLYTSQYAKEGYGNALVRTNETGALDEEAACALLDAVLQTGGQGGSLEVADEAEFLPRFLSVAGAALDDVGLASQLLNGGFLGRLGQGPFTFGSLPLRVIRRQVTPTTLRSARTRVELGWDSDLVNLLESAALLAEREPEQHLVVLNAPMVRLPSTPVDSAPPMARPKPLDIDRLLAEAMGLGAQDVFLQSGRPPSFHGPRGSATRGEPLSRETLFMVAARLGTSVDSDVVQVGAMQVEAVGRVRVSASKAGIALRVLGPSAFLAPGLDSLLGLKRGLVVIGGPPASGRSTSFSAMLHASFDAGHVIASLEEPVSFPRCDFQWNAEPTKVEPFFRAVRTSAASVVGFDFIDDAVSVDLALRAAQEGRLAVCTMLGLSLGALVERLAVLDAPAQRRRVAEHLVAVACLTPGSSARILLPSDALRRHLAQEVSPPPPELLGRTDG